MKLRQLALAAAITTATLSSALVAPSAFAQAKEQFFPSLVYRTGAYAPNGVPFANGYADYLKLTNAFRRGDFVQRSKRQALVGCSESGEWLRHQSRLLRDAAEQRSCCCVPCQGSCRA